MKNLRKPEEIHSCVSVIFYRVFLKNSYYLFKPLCKDDFHEHSIFLGPFSLHP